MSPSSPPFPPPPASPCDAPARTSPRDALQSLTLRGAVAMAFAYAAGRFGVDLGAPEANVLAARALDLVFTLGVMAVGVGRARAQGPLT